MFNPSLLPRNAHYHGSLIQLNRRDPANFNSQLTRISPSVGNLRGYNPSIPNTDFRLALMEHRKLQLLKQQQELRYPSQNSRPPSVSSMQSEPPMMPGYVMMQRRRPSYTPSEPSFHPPPSPTESMFSTTSSIGRYQQRPRKRMMQYDTIGPRRTADGRSMPNVAEVDGSASPTDLLNSISAGVSKPTGGKVKTPKLPNIVEISEGSKETLHDTKPYFTYDKRANRSYPGLKKKPAPNVTLPPKPRRSYKYDKIKSVDATKQEEIIIGDKDEEETQLKNRSISKEENVLELVGENNREMVQNVIFEPQPQEKSAEQIIIGEEPAGLSELLNDLETKGIQGIVNSEEGSEEIPCVETEI